MKDFLQKMNKCRPLSCKYSLIYRLERLDEVILHIDTLLVS
jgi:hypothetical protein